MNFRSARQSYSKRSVQPTARHGRAKLPVSPRWSNSVRRDDTPMEQPRARPRHTPQPYEGEAQPQDEDGAAPSGRCVNRAWGETPEFTLGVDRVEALCGPSVGHADFRKEKVVMGTTGLQERVKEERLVAVVPHPVERVAARVPLFEADRAEVHQIAQALGDEREVIGIARATGAVVRLVGNFVTNATALAHFDILVARPNAWSAYASVELNIAATDSHALVPLAVLHPKRGIRVVPGEWVLCGGWVRGDLVHQFKVAIATPRAPIVVFAPPTRVPATRLHMEIEQSGGVLLCTQRGVHVARIKLAGAGDRRDTDA